MSIFSYKDGGDKQMITLQEEMNEHVIKIKNYQFIRKKEALI